MTDDPRCWTDLAEENARLREENARIEALLTHHREAAAMRDGALRLSEEVCAGLRAQREELRDHVVELKAEVKALRAAIGETHAQEPFDHEGGKS